MTTLSLVPPFSPTPIVSAWALGALVLATALLGACSSDGRELSEPRDWQTTTTRPPPPTSAPPNQLGETGMGLASPEFDPGGEVPIDLMCLGANRSPALTWTDVPSDAVELALALSNQTDPTDPLLLWLVAGIDPDSAGLTSGTLPAGAVEALNDYGQAGWGNPCIESAGEGSLDLQFRLYALPEPSGIGPGDPGNESWELVAALAFDSATLLMTGEGNP